MPEDTKKFGLFSALKSSATPQGSRQKRARAEGPSDQQEEEDPGVVKLLCKVSSLLLKKDRDQDCRIGTTILLPQKGDKQHGLTEAMKNVKQLYADNVPQREQGKGKPHPWGAPRNANLAAFIDYTVQNEYQGPNGPELEKIAKEVWSEKDLQNLTQVLFKMTSDCVTNGNFTPLDPLCEYFTFRETRNGLGLLELTGARGRCFAQSVREAGLGGVLMDDLWGLLLLPYMDYVQKGSAPQGRLERQVNRHVYKGK